MHHHLPAPARRLAWDSDFFGFGVAAIEDPAIPDAALFELLGTCRRAGVVLAHWNAAAGRTLPEPRLAEFGGRLIERRLTYSRPLPAGAGDPPPLPIEERERRDADEELLELAVAAGEHSRFRVDPRVPAGKFAELYREWMERSCTHQLADAVLVAREGKRAAGVITVLLEKGAESEARAARIALVAVRADLRGRGIARSLLDAAHRFMERREARLSRVVTQAANAPACALYARAGYALAEERNGHHFWLAAP